MNSQNATRREEVPIVTDHHLLLKFSLLLLGLSIPFYLFGSQKLPIPVNLPVSALMFINPAIVAFILIYRRSGWPGVRRLAKRVFEIPKNQNKIWYLPSLVTIPLIYAVSYGIMRWIGRSLPDANINLFITLGFFAVYFIAAIFEEVGWQGFLFDPLRSRWGAFKASIMIGLVWQLWHLIPLIQANNSASWIFWHLLEGVALRVLMVWIYTKAGRSVLTAVLMHASTNVSWSMFPEFGSAYDPFFTAVLTCLTAGLFVIGWKEKSLIQNDDARASQGD